MKEAKGMISRIILCMGASIVEAAADPKFASMKLEDYDYVIVDDYAKVSASVRKLRGCVPFKWAKECLIAGRLLPVIDDR